nr:O-antigen ligase family protein [Winogradskyella flava]
MIFVVIILSVAISFTTSRIVYIMYFLVACIYSYSKLPTKKFKYSIIIIGVIVSLLIMNNKSIFNKFTSSFSYNDSPRLKLWSNAFEAVEESERYAFGIGLGDFYKDKKDVYFGEYYGNKTVGAYGYNPHSQLVEFYLTNGVFGLAVIMLALIFYLFRLKNQNIFALSTFTIVFLFSLFECIFNRQYGVQLYSVVIPIIISRNFKRI